MHSTKLLFIGIASLLLMACEGGQSVQTGDDGAAEGNVAANESLTRSIKLYVFDCGRLRFASIAGFNLKQTDTDVASFDRGYGSAYLAKQIGQKFAREIFFLGKSYTAEQAHHMGMVNAVVPHAKLEETAFSWAKEIMSKSPTAIKMLKFGFNLIDDGLVGQQVYAGEATRLAYGTEEAKEGRDAFLEKRPRDFSRFPKFP